MNKEAKRPYFIKLMSQEDWWLVVGLDIAIKWQISNFQWQIKSQIQMSKWIP